MCQCCLSDSVAIIFLRGKCSPAFYYLAPLKLFDILIFLPNAELVVQGPNNDFRHSEQTLDVSTFHHNMFIRACSCKLSNSHTGVKPLSLCFHYTFTLKTASKSVIFRFKLLLIVFNSFCYKDFLGDFLGDYHLRGIGKLLCGYFLTVLDVT